MGEQEAIRDKDDAHPPNAPALRASPCARCNWEEAPAIQALFPQWEIVRHLASRVPWPYPADGALLYLCDIALPAMQRGREWHWTLRLQQHPRQLIGQISLYDSPNDNRGLWLAPEWQGQGLMQEGSHGGDGLLVRSP